MNHKKDRVDRSPAYLHPEEEPLRPCLKLEHVDPPTGALRHPLELTVIRKDNQVLATQEQSNDRQTDRRIQVCTTKV